MVSYELLRQGYLLEPTTPLSASSAAPRAGTRNSLHLVDAGLGAGHQGRCHKSSLHVCRDGMESGWMGSDEGVGGREESE